MPKDFYSLKSMTAYGRGVAHFSYGRFAVEIQSVNRRYLEIKVGLPHLLMRFEMPIRKKIAERLGRGMVHVSVLWRAEAEQPVNVVPNLPLAKGIKLAWTKLAQEMDIEPSIDLQLLAREKSLLLYEEEVIDEKSYYKALETALDEALDHLIGMRQQEGSRIGQELQKRLKIIEKSFAYVETHSQDAVEKYRKNLLQRLEEVLSQSVENEERILREMAIFAERIDITEEIVRFKSHLVQFHMLLEKSVENETRGKTLDFLIQEFNREINTIGSKNADKEIAKQVVLVKSELEKIREQTQNIE